MGAPESNFCLQCGTRLESRPSRDGGTVPYCPVCGVKRYAQFNVAVILITVDPEEGKILLIRQYGRPDYILVAGYVNRGEDAEHAAARELLEETGLAAKKIVFHRSEYMARGDVLMLNYVCVAENARQLHTNDEIDDHRWFTPEQARQNIKPGSLARKFLLEVLDEHPDLQF